MDNMATIAGTTIPRNDSSYSSVPPYELLGVEMLKAVAAIMLALAIAVPAWAGAAHDRALLDAAYALDVEGVKGALKNGANPNALDSKRWTALGLVALANMRGLSNPSLAAKKAGFMDRETANSNAVEITKALFAGGAKLGPNSKEIMWFPISRGNVQLVTLLIDKGASVKARFADGYTPTDLAWLYNQEAVYKLLVSRGGISIDRHSSAQLELIAAATHRDVEGMEAAIKGGAQVNGLDASNATALTAALQAPIIEPNDVLAIVWLLDHGADPNLKGKKLPLHEFVKNSIFLNGVKGPYPKQLSEDTLGRLLKAGAKISGVDEFGSTPLHIAATFDMVGAAEILIREGAKVMPRDNLGKTPLDYAESAAMIKLLKQNGASEH